MVCSLCGHAGHNRTSCGRGSVRKPNAKKKESSGGARRGPSVLSPNLPPALLEMLQMQPGMAGAFLGGGGGGGYGGGGGFGGGFFDDDDDDDVYPEAQGEEDTGDGAFDAVRSTLAQSGLDVIMLEDPLPNITMNGLLAQRHILLPKPVVASAMGLRKRMLNKVYDWPGGGTSCGNDIFFSHFQPLSKQAARDVKAGRFSEAFGPLLGLALFGLSEDGWVNDNEVYMESSFSGMFKTFSTAWKGLLAQSDGTLGLVPAVGKPGGYRGELTALIRKWELEINEDLSMYDEHGAKPRVRIFSLRD
jgi:hypothetical protein